MSIITVSLLLLGFCSTEGAVFTQRVIGQSNPLAAGKNTITVSIKTSTPLESQSILTISGLTGAPDNNNLGVTSKPAFEHANGDLTAAEDAWFGEGGTS